MPTSFAFMRRRAPAAVKSRIFLAGCVLFYVGMLVALAGFTCAENAVPIIDECDRHGKWNTSVQLRVGGGAEHRRGVAARDADRGRGRDGSLRLNGTLKIEHTDTHY